MVRKSSSPLISNLSPNIIEEPCLLLRPLLCAADPMLALLGFRKLEVPFNSLVRSILYLQLIFPYPFHPYPWRQGFRRYRGRPRFHTASASPLAAPPATALPQCRGPQVPFWHLFDFASSPWTINPSSPCSMVKGIFDVFYVGDLGVCKCSYAYGLEDTPDHQLCEPFGLSGQLARRLI